MRFSSAALLPRPRIRVSCIMSDNGVCYRSERFRPLWCAGLASAHLWTRLHIAQRQGQALHSDHLRGWADQCRYESSVQRTSAAVAAPLKLAYASYQPVTDISRASLPLTTYWFYTSSASSTVCFLAITRMSRCATKSVICVWHCCNPMAGFAFFNVVAGAVNARKGDWFSFISE